MTITTEARIAALVRQAIAFVDNAKVRQGLIDAAELLTVLRDERDLFKNQLSVQEARTAEWHQACDTAEAAARACHNCTLTLVACYDARHVNGKVACCPECDHRPSGSAPRNVTVEGE